MKTTFWEGFVAHAACLSLYQDLLGKEKYLAVVNERWTSATWTVPIALVALLWAIISRVYKDSAMKHVDASLQERRYRW